MSIHNSGYIICSPFVHGAHGHAMAERWVTEQWCHGHSAWSMAFQALALVQSQLLGDWCWKWFVPCFWGGGFSLELLMLIIDLHHLHPNIHWLSTVIPFNLSNFTDSSFPILYTPSARQIYPNKTLLEKPTPRNPVCSRWWSHYFYRHSTQISSMCHWPPSVTWLLPCKSSMPWVIRC